MKRLQNKSLNFIVFLLLSQVLMWPAYYNGYPLVYSDSGTYIASGYLNEVPIDRPIMYGLFVRHISLAFSLWIVLTVQSLLVIYIIHYCVKKFLESNVLVSTSIIVLALSFLSSISNYVSQLMPDIFTALCILGYALVLLKEQWSKWDFFLILVLVFASISHLSNILIVLSLNGVGVLFYLFKQIKIKQLLIASSITLLSFLSILSINKYFTNEFKLSSASNVFMFGRMIETGVIKEFLQKNCATKTYQLCTQVDRLPAQSFVFIWDYEKSPLYLGSCMQEKWSKCWKEKNKELGEIMHDVLSEATYRNRVIAHYFKDFVKQLFLIDVGALVPQREGTPIYEWMKFKFKNEFQAYKNARQYKQTLSFSIFSQLQKIIVVLSLLVICFAFIWKKKFNLSKNFKLFVGIIFSGLILNALFVSIFSTIIERYQSRIIWVIPFIAFIILFRQVKMGSKNFEELNISPHE